MGAAGGLASMAGGMLNTLGGQEQYIGQIKGLKSQQHMNDLRLTERKRQLRKELSTFSRKADISYGDTVSSFAKAGVDLSESPLMVLNDQRNEFNKTLSDIQVSGETDIELLKMGGQAINDQIKSTRNAQGLAWLGGNLSTTGSFLTSGASFSGGSSGGGRSSGGGFSASEQNAFLNSGTVPRG